MDFPSGGRKGRRWLMPVAALLLAASVFTALGVWQVRRLAWKQALIARVAEGLAGPARDAAGLRAPPAEYSKITATGQFEPAATLVTASTQVGPGYWVMAPLRLADGRAIWVNRGFVRAATGVASPAGQQTIIGLARVAETSHWMRANRPAEHRWYSRDIAAIAAQTHVAGSETGWFIDAGLPAATAPTIADDDEALAPPAPPGGNSPIPGLTVVRFANNHLGYAVTWFLLAGFSLAGLGVVIRTDRPRNP